MYVSGAPRVHQRGPTVRSLPFPRRLQLVKLLRAHGLRDVERLREDELKDALSRLSLLLPDLAQTLPTMAAPPPASIMVSRPSDDVVPATIDDEDAWCLPRFREPRLFVPEGERTFLRLVAVKPRVLFFTWDLAADVDKSAPARLDIVLRDALGAPPAAADVVDQPASLFVDVDLRAPGWYVDVAPERYAVVARLVQGERVVATSNLALTPPARPAPPGPLWHATLTPSVDRRVLRDSGLLRSKLPEGASVAVDGEVLPEPTAYEVSLPLPSSGERARGLGEAAAAPPSSAAMPSRSRLPVVTSNPSSSSLPSSSAVAAGRSA
jgi:hypothetical protein